MKVYVVGCGHARSGRTLAQAIGQLGPSWQCQDSTWLIQTALSAVEILDLVKPHVDTGEVLVARLSEEIAWSGFPEEAARWLHEHIVPAGPAASGA